VTEPTTPTPASSGGDTIRCSECGNEVPALDYCVRCGDPLAEEKQARAALTGRRTQFAAQPDEHALGLHLVSTLFPQLPRADMATFRAVLVIGLLVIVGLAIAGLFPLALIAAALLVPLMLVLYIWDVDVYEDEPIRVMVFTAAWGIVAGVIVGLLTQLLPAGRGVLIAVPPSEILWRSVLVPLAGGILMLAGPLVLLRYRKFNDVLDGATFGATSAAAFTAALVLSQGSDLFGSGLRPPGDSLPWIVRLLSLGIASPLIAAGVIGAAAGAFWLRYRAPLRDRARLGLVGQPLVATVLALGFLIASALGAQLLPFLQALLWQTFLAILALLWLRAVIHLGLLEEAAEIDIGPPITCPNCGRQTPAHSFCGNCGASLRAVPKAGPRRAAVRPDQPA
jgi:RsiW-degrading membrane proteinase PrsW (M82 family)